MLKRIKTWIMAVLLAVVFPTIRMADGKEAPAAQRKAGENPAPEQGKTEEPAAGAAETGGKKDGDKAQMWQKSESQTQADPAARAKELEGILAAREGELSQAKEKIQGLEKAAALNIARVNLLEASLKTIVGRYRDLIVETNPEIPPEMITGESPEALDKSMEKAKGLIEKVKANLQDQAKNVRVPAGAPERGARDTSGLSAREKIRQGLGK